MPTSVEEIAYHWYDFHDLTAGELYAILKLRQEVFVVEQRCAYQDCDNLDLRAWHLVGWYQSGEKVEPVAYLRVLLPEDPGAMVAIGRLVLRAELRGRGEGKNLFALALRRIGQVYPEVPVRISAQHHLLRFYQDFGFDPASGVYDEDGIPHIAMIRRPQQLP